jgi:hypothetical protein
MAKLNVPLSYPLTAADEPRAINRLAMAVALVRHALNKEYSVEWLETTLRSSLREGGLTLAEKTVEAADKGDRIADAALRDVGAELQVDLLQRRDLKAGHLQIIAYYQRAARRPLQKRKQGRYSCHDHWCRNMGICFLIQLASAEYGVEPTRNLNSRSVNREPSGISLVAAALARNKINLEEGTIQQHIWFGVWGELARRLPTVETWITTVVSRQFRQNMGT